QGSGGRRGRRVPREIVSTRARRGRFREHDRLREPAPLRGPAAPDLRALVRDPEPRARARPRDDDPDSQAVSLLALSLAEAAAAGMRVLARLPIDELRVVDCDWLAIAELGLGF